MISQFKSKKALKKIRMKKQKKRNINLLRSLYAYRNSPKRRIKVDFTNIPSAGTIAR